MVCQACGSPVQGAFCSQCGAAVAGQPMNPPPPVYPYPVPEMRVQRNLQTLGILWCIYGGYRAITGIIGALFLAGITTGGFIGGWGHLGGFPFANVPFMGEWMAGIAGFVAVISLIFAGLSFLVGFALLNRKPWGRVLAIVLSILQLIKIPFGTALGIYTLWVLAPSTCGAEYDSIAVH
jgi:hypothetical protein